MGTNLFGYEAHVRPLGNRWLRAAIIPTRSAFLSTIEVEGEEAIVYRRELRFVSLQEATLDLHAQLRVMDEVPLEDLQRCAMVKVAMATVPTRLVYDAKLSNEARHEGESVRLGPKFFTLPADGQVAVLAHEVGHALSDAMLHDGSAWELVDQGAFGGGINGEKTPGENLAEAYALYLLEPETLRERWPKVHQAISEAIGRYHFPTNTEAAIGHLLSEINHLRPDNQAPKESSEESGGSGMAQYDSLQGSFYQEALALGLEGFEAEEYAHQHAVAALPPEIVKALFPEESVKGSEESGEFDTHEPTSIGDVMPKTRYLGELLLTTVFVKRAGSTENYLQSLGVQPDVIQFVMSQPEDVAKRLVNEVRKNHNLTIDQLTQLMQGLAGKQKYAPTQRELALAGRFEDIPGMPQWVLLQTKKYRATKNMVRNPLPNFPNHEFDYAWPPGVAHLNIVSPQALQAAGRAFAEIGDWVRATQVQIASYDLLTAKAESDKWHEEQAAQGAGSGGYQEKHVVHTFKNGWTIQQVKTANDLEVEGNLMGHCVGSYCDSVARGMSYIYSLRDPQNTPHATIETSTPIGQPKHLPKNRLHPDEEQEQVPVEVVQIQGKQNQEPIPEYKAMIKEWFQSLGPENLSMQDGGEEIEDKLSALEPEDWAGFLWGDASNEYGIGGETKRYQEVLREYNNNGYTAMTQLYGWVEEHLANIYGRREMAFRHNPMTNIAYAIADLAWDADVSRAMTNSLALVPGGPGSPAIAGLEVRIDNHRETFDRDILSASDTGLRPDEFETEEQFFEAEQKIHDEWFAEWMAGGMDLAIMKRWQERIKETKGLWPTEIAMNLAEGKKPLAPRNRKRTV